MAKVFLMLIASLWLISPAYAQTDQYDLVIKAPDKGEPQWTVGKQRLTLGPDVEIKPSAGRLMAGSCVQVEKSDSTVTKVQTRPMVNCDTTDYVAFLETYSRLAEE